MAGGPLYPSSLKIEDSPDIFGDVFIGDGANAHETEVIGVIASLGADVEMDLEFPMPSTLPTGTAKLVMIALADAVTGVAKHNPAWASVAAGQDPSSFTLTAEGVETTTWAAAEDDVYKQTKTTLDADTIVASEIIVMHVKFETSGWTLAVVSGWLRPWIIWE